MSSDNKIDLSLRREKERNWRDFPRGTLFTYKYGETDTVYMRTLDGIVSLVTGLTYIPSDGMDYLLELTEPFTITPGDHS